MQKDHACEYKKSAKLQNALEVSRRSWSLVNNGKTVDEVRAELKERSETKKAQLLEELKPRFKPALCNKSMQIFSQSQDQS